MTRQILVAVAVVATAGVGFAAGQERPRAGKDRTRLREELGLSQDQASQLQKLRLDSRTAAIRRHADARIARLALRQALQAPSVDEKAVQAKVKELSDLHAAQLRARVDAQLALRQILTPEQREKMQARRADRAVVRGERKPRARRGNADGEREREPLTHPDVR